MLNGEDFVEHNDILSSPAKSRNVTPKRVDTHGERQLRIIHSSKKNLLERISLVDNERKNTSPDPALKPKTPSKAPRKRGRPRKIQEELTDRIKKDEKDTISSKKKRKLDKDTSGNVNEESKTSNNKQVMEKTGIKDKREREKIQVATTTYEDNVTSQTDDNFVSKSPEPPEPATPSKKSLTTNHDFTSPLKQIIMNNLKEYKDSTSPGKLTLSRNFTPTPVPKNKKLYQTSETKSASSFLDTFEGYFDQRKIVRTNAKSRHTMSMAPDVTREEFSLVSNFFNENFQKRPRQKLFEIQKKMFPQYWFELTQGFSLLFYGVGSKRNFLEEFAIDYLSPKIAYSQLAYENELQQNKPVNSIPCLILNGYNPSCNYRDVFKEITDLLVPAELTRSETKYWGNHVILQIQKMIDFYKNQPLDIKLILVVHNLDGPSIRKNTFQTMLSFLSVIRQIAIVASTDHIYAPLLWDNMKAQNYNFVFHDISNFEPSTVESTFQDVMKMGKSDTSSGAEGAKYVLQSLTVNSKKMYKLLIETQMQNMGNLSANTGPKRGTQRTGVELKLFNHLCAADFIASNEIALRSMLREFIEHKMANITKNNSGMEIIWVPYTYAELEKLLKTVLNTL
ncbi:CEI_1a_G0002440.mRNA.1.CDS.1 [Saccharomyces cerevisiae]|nr:EM14S01-3B_G0014370.mRNA.1.CDS.1 [Saccharomyces cerevisiae]CAI4262190.1 AMH_1a_G0002580.mRNA.1.CDS.1 [Saccharomyces cerevisiae]CAI4266533.1 CEI_1a_G0002440.mRNA.1.CDS.1 [Saccharomyces cerevisiae]CAI6489718.1 AMH_1a_G0002580.mRNA.1.CDS.1 [Saccharomyces cerevisiae]CAI7141888.1 CEI_1a_G0002440.mRNA.1.CDS.1 [Saccharomyces cerevisiae]